jgi:hypothetical protein
LDALHGVTEIRLTMEAIKAANAAELAALDAEQERQLDLIRESKETGLTPWELEYARRSGISIEVMRFSKQADEYDSKRGR